MRAYVPRLRLICSHLVASIEHWPLKAGNFPPMELLTEVRYSFENEPKCTFKDCDLLPTRYIGTHLSKGLLDPPNASARGTPSPRPRPQPVVAPTVIPNAMESALAVPSSTFLRGNETPSAVPNVGRRVCSAAGIPGGSPCWSVCRTNEKEAKSECLFAIVTRLAD